MIRLLLAVAMLAAPVMKEGDETPRVEPKQELTHSTQVRVSTLAGMVFTLRGEMRHITMELVSRVESAARRVVAARRYRWLTPELLVGLAINESDLRPGLRAGFDCGITQIRVTVRYKNRRRARKYCQELVDDVYLAFRHTAEVLTVSRDKYCGYWWRRWKKSPEDRHARRRFRRCVLNVYNQGPWYYRREKCGDDRRCRYKAGYWNRVSCFAAALKSGHRPRWRCRRVGSARGYGELCG